MKTIRYEKISEQAYSLLRACDIREYPINFRELTSARTTRALNIEFETYESFERYSPNARRIFGSKDGAAAYLPGEGFYIVFYNSAAEPQGRINWTIAHEIGHILMGHYTHGETDEPDAEREADHFAKLLLCHPLLLEKCGIRDKDGIQQLCGISGVAAANRERELKSGSFSCAYNKWDKLTEELFADFISKKKCLSCGKVTVGADKRFCGYCGGSGFRRGVDVFLTKIRRHAKCPVCENQDIKDSNFCKICGLNLKNPCTLCGRPTEISAYFCPYCKAVTELSTVVNDTVSNV